jgi:hypothetical protein
MGPVIEGEGEYPVRHPDLRDGGSALEMRRSRRHGGAQPLLDGPICVV